MKRREIGSMQLQASNRSSWDRSQQQSHTATLAIRSSQGVPRLSHPCRGLFSWNGTLYMDQKVCLNLVKKDQLCAIALMNRK